MNRALKKNVVNVLFKSSFGIVMLTFIFTSISCVILGLESGASKLFSVNHLQVEFADSPIGIGFAGAKQ